MEIFDFKELIVWQKGMDFAEVCLDICEGISGHFRLVEQLEASSASIPQNIAEGKGRHSHKEFINFLYYSRGSLYESITLLNLFQRKAIITSNQLQVLEQDALVILKMINALISSKRKDFQ
jgi:four helix bundle protein